MRWDVRSGRTPKYDIWLDELNDALARLHLQVRLHLRHQQHEGGSEEGVRRDGAGVQQAEPGGLAAAAGIRHAPCTHQGHQRVCPVSALTQLCPHSSAPFFIVKGLYLGQVS